MRATKGSALSLPQLAARAQLGDREALETLLTELARQLGPHVEHLIGDSDRAADVMQEVLLRIARKLPSLREHAWVRAWAYRIATRDALRYVASSRRYAFTSLDEAANLASPESDDGRRFDPALVSQLPAAVAALPEGCQIVVRLHYLDGLSQPEIAEVLSIALGTVKSRIAYGLRLLRSRFRSEDT